MIYLLLTNLFLAYIFINLLLKIMHGSYVYKMKNLNKGFVLNFVTNQYSPNYFLVFVTMFLAGTQSFAIYWFKDHLILLAIVTFLALITAIIGFNIFEFEDNDLLGISLMIPLIYLVLPFALIFGIINYFVQVYKSKNLNVSEVIFKLNSTDLRTAVDYLYRNEDFQEIEKIITRIFRINESYKLFNFTNDRYIPEEYKDLNFELMNVNVSKLDKKIFGEIKQGIKLNPDELYNLIIRVKTIEGHYPVKNYKNSLKNSLFPTYTEYNEFHIEKITSVEEYKLNADLLVQNLYTISERNLKLFVESYISGLADTKAYSNRNVKENFKLSESDISKLHKLINSLKTNFDEVCVNNYLVNIQNIIEDNSAKFVYFNDEHIEKDIGLFMFNDYSMAKFLNVNILLLFLVENYFGELPENMTMLNKTKYICIKYGLIES